jgi:hypothetical protein
MKKRRISLIVTVALITILLAVSPVMAKATRTEWTEQQTTCALYCPEGEECVIDNANIYQQRGQVGIYRSERYDPVTLERHPEWDGWAVTIENADLNFNTGDGTAWGTFIRYFDEKDGTFEGTWVGTIRDFRFTGKITGKGTGVFEGQIDKGWVDKVPVNDLPLGIGCPTEDEWGEVNHGYYLDPQGQ